MNYVSGGRKSQIPSHVPKYVFMASPQVRKGFTELGDWPFSRIFEKVEGNRRKRTGVFCSENR